MSLSLESRLEVDCWLDSSLLWDPGLGHGLDDYPAPEVDKDSAPEAFLWGWGALGQTLLALGSDLGTAPDLEADQPSF